MSSILGLLEMERKSGVLRVANGTNQGRVLLSEGRVIQAEIAGGPTRGATAVYEMLAWDVGQFGFTSREIQVKDEIGATTAHLLLQGAAMRDEQEHQDGAGSKQHI